VPVVGQEPLQASHLLTLLRDDPAAAAVSKECAFPGVSAWIVTVITKTKVNAIARCGMPCVPRFGALQIGFCRSAWMSQQKGHPVVSSFTYIHPNHLSSITRQAVPSQLLSVSTAAAPAYRHRCCCLLSSFSARCSCCRRQHALIRAVPLGPRCSCCWQHQHAPSRAVDASTRRHLCTSAPCACKGPAQEPQVWTPVSTSLAAARLWLTSLHHSAVLAAAACCVLCSLSNPHAKLPCLLPLAACSLQLGVRRERRSQAASTVWVPCAH
jgi:hypothetical protein